MAQYRDERLRARIDSQPLLAERKPTIPEKSARRHFAELWFANDKRHAGVAARYRMADAISFLRIEEQYLVPFSHRFVARHIPHIDTAVREHQLRLNGVLFGTLAA
jgi:hypothetical protein